MRLHTTFAGAFAGLLLASAVSPLAAQPQPPGAPTRSPTFSPYLNLANRGGTFNPGITYLGIVRPQQLQAQQNSQFQQQFAQTNQAVATNTNALNDNLYTGRGATFGYYSHYYYNSPTGGGGISGGGGFRTGGTTAGGFVGGGFGGGAASVFRPGGSASNIGMAPRPALRTNTPRR